MACSALECLVRAVGSDPGHRAIDRARLLLGFHLDLADLAACCLSHLAFDERCVMPALNAALRDRDLETVTIQIRSSVPPADMSVLIRYTVPAMEFAERLDMLAGAPAEIFEQFRATTHAALPPQGYEAVVLAAGFA